MLTGVAVVGNGLSVHENLSFLGSIYTELQHCILLPGELGKGQHCCSAARRLQRGPPRAAAAPQPCGLWAHSRCHSARHRQNHGAALVPAALSQGMLLILLSPCIITSVQQSPGCTERAEAMPSLAGNQSCPLDSVEGFSLTRRRWELLPPMPTGRCSCSSCPAPDLLFVIGGVDQGPSGAVEALCLRDAP